MSVESELKWVAYFRQFIGARLVKAGKINPIFINHINKAFSEVGLRPFVINQETPISGSFLGAMFAVVGLADKIPRSFYRPIDWQTAGTKLQSPAYGCVAIISVNDTYKAGIVVGKTEKGLIKILAADQGPEINMTDYPIDSIVSLRWVGETQDPSVHRYTLPVLRAGVIKSKLF